MGDEPLHAHDWVRPNEVLSESDFRIESERHNGATQIPVGDFSEKLSRILAGNHGQRTDIPPNRPICLGDLCNPLNSYAWSRSANRPFGAGRNSLCRRWMEEPTWPTKSGEGLHRSGTQPKVGSALTCGQPRRAECKFSESLGDERYCGDEGASHRTSCTCGALTCRTGTGSIGSRFPAISFLAHPSRRRNRLRFLRSSAPADFDRDERHQEAYRRDRAG